MKKVSIISILIFVVSANLSAQISMKNFMRGLEEGQSLEKGFYKSRRDVPELECWMGAINSSPVRGAESPVVGEPLSWTGYGERDKSIILGSSFPEGVHGQRPICYGFQRSITAGNLYLSFIVDLKTVRNRKYWTAVGFSNQVWGVQSWSCVVFYPAANDGKTYNIGIRLSGGIMVVDRIFETGYKHLIVLKYDLDEDLLSVFIDPDLSKPEPLPDEKVTFTIPVEKSMVSGLYVRDVSDNEGRIGSFRVARVWEDIR